MTKTQVEQYIDKSPKDVRLELIKLRRMIFEIAPEAVESMAYGIPAYKIEGKPFVYFAYFKEHLGLYPTPSGIKAFEKELSKYKQGKGSVQFPFDKPIPYTLIKKIVKFRRSEILK